MKEIGPGTVAGGASQAPDYIGPAGSLSSKTTKRAWAVEMGASPAGGMINTNRGRWVGMMSTTDRQTDRHSRERLLPCACTRVSVGEDSTSSTSCNCVSRASY